MKSLSYLLITVGFLVGAYLAVERTEGVALGPYLLAVLVGAVGVAMLRYSSHQSARHEDVVAANLGAIETSLGEIVERVQKLDREKNEIDVYDLRHIIDAEFPDAQNAFVEARESIAHSYGLQAYADVMNPFAAGERYLNRVWSTSTDGYIDEAHKYVTKAREQFEEALGTFRELGQPSPSPS